MSGEPYTGLTGALEPKPQWLKTIGVFQKRIVAFVIDLVVLLYLWVISSYSWNSLRYEQESFLSLPWWMMLISVVGLVVIWEMVGLSLGTKVAGVKQQEGGDSKREAKKKWYQTSWGISTFLLIALTILAGLLITEVDFKALLTGAPRTGRVWRSLVTPWTADDFRGTLVMGIELLTVTIFMALMATLFGVLFAVPLSFLAARNLMKGWIGRTIYTITRVVMSIMRSIEPIIWAIVFVVWVRIGPFAGVLALMIHSIADLTKLYSERLESIDTDPVEAITATGANRFQVILYGIIPQIINPYLSFTLYRWDINVRMSTIIGIVGGGGIGQMLYQFTRLWKWQEAGLMMWMIVVVVWTIDYTSSRLRARLE
ncbi:MAG: phosphonate ABC transporter, permease protein PhnE [Candidatus Bipolaricaulia bacterium]